MRMSAIGELIRKQRNYEKQSTTTSNLANSSEFELMQFSVALKEAQEILLRTRKKTSVSPAENGRIAAWCKKCAEILKG